MKIHLKIIYMCLYMTTSMCVLQLKIVEVYNFLFWLCSRLSIVSKQFVVAEYKMELLNHACFNYQYTREHVHIYVIEWRSKHAVISNILSGFLLSLFIYLFFAIKQASYGIYLQIIVLILSANDLFSLSKIVTKRILCIPKL